MPTEFLDAFITFVNTLRNDDANQVQDTADFASGVVFYDILAAAAPHAFTERDGIKEEAGSWIIKKSNLQKVCGGMTTYAQQYLGAQSDFMMEELTDVSAIAKSNDEEEVDKLASLVLTMLIQSQSSAVMNTLRGLDRETGTRLSQPVKAMKAKHNLQKASESPSGAGNNGDRSVTPGAMASEVATPVTSDASGKIKIYDETSGENPVVLKQEILDQREKIQRLEKELNVERTKAEMLDKTHTELKGKYDVLMEETHGKGISTKEREFIQTISEKDDKIRSLGGDISELTSKINELKQEVAEMDEQCNAKQASVAELEEQIELVKIEREEMQTKLNFQEDRAEMNAKKREEVESELSEAIEESKKLKKQLAAAESKRRDNDDDDDEEGGSMKLRMENKRLQNDLNAAQSKLSLLAQAAHHDDSDLNETVETLREELRAELEKVKKLEAECDELKQRPPVVEEKIVEVEKPVEIPAAADAPASKEVMEQLEQMQKQISNVTDAKAEVEAQLQAAKQALVDAERMRGKESERVLELEREKEKLSQHHSTAIGEIQNLQEQLSAAASKPPEEAEEIKILRKENKDLLSRMEVAREAVKKENTTVMSCLVDFGQRNLLLQQQGMVNKYATNALTRGSDAEDVATNGTKYEAMTFLTRHRRQAERGLLEKIANQSSGGHKRSGK